MNNSNIRSIHKINTLELFPQELDFVDNSEEFVSQSLEVLGVHPKLLSFRRVYPDFLVETERGKFLFLEVKSFSPTNGAVIYEAQLEGQLAYERFGIPVHYLLIRHSIRDITACFAKGWDELKRLAEELSHPLMVAHFTRAAVATLCENSGNAWIEDKRKAKDPVSNRFKVLRKMYLEKTLEENAWSRLVLA